MVWGGCRERGASDAAVCESGGEERGAVTVVQQSRVIAGFCTDGRLCDTGESWLRARGDDGDMREREQIDQTGRHHAAAPGPAPLIAQHQAQKYNDVGRIEHLAR